MRIDSSPGNSNIRLSPTFATLTVRWSKPSRKWYKSMLKQNEKISMVVLDKMVMIEQPPVEAVAPRLSGSIRGIALPDRPFSAPLLIYLAYLKQVASLPQFHHPDRRHLPTPLRASLPH